jgi:DivIVA domain-containing protein
MSDEKTPTLHPEIAGAFKTLPDDPVALIKLPAFPLTMRGYDRHAVDEYVDHVTRLVAALQSVRSPEAAIHRALEHVGEQVSEILTRAHATAEELTSKSRADADSRLGSSQTEASQTLASANAEAEATLTSSRTEADETLTSARTEAEATLSKARAEATALVARAKAEANETLSGARSAAAVVTAAAKAEAAQLTDVARAKAETILVAARAEAERLTAEGSSRAKQLDGDIDRIWGERKRIIDDVKYLSGQLAELAASANAAFPEDTDITGEVEAIGELEPFGAYGQPAPVPANGGVPPPVGPAEDVPENVETAVMHAIRLPEDEPDPSAG